jgi:hypothetical protein
MEICQGLHLDRTIPIDCGTWYDQEKRTGYLVVTFQNIATKDKALDVLNQQISNDFCRISNDVGVTGVLGTVLAEESLMNVYDCQTRRHSGWFRTQDPKTQLRAY